MILDKKKKDNIISICFESEEMREHLTEHSAEITQRQWIDIIRGAPIPLDAKAGLMRDVDETCYMEIKDALEALELKEDQFFIYSWNGYEMVDGNLEITEDCIAPCRDLKKVREDLRKEMFDAPEGEDLWEHRLETGYWAELELYGPDGDGGFRNPYTYYLIADQVCYFEKKDKPDKNGFYYRPTDMSCSWQTVHLNVDIPFRPGDIVTVDSRPFAGPKQVLITEVGSDCCGVQALYWSGRDEAWDTRALKHGGIYDEDMPMISPLYRVKRGVGSLEEECTMSLCWKLIDESISFVIISAEDQDQSPRATIAEVRAEVRKLGFASSEFIARWEEEGESRGEKRHVLIKGFTLKQAIRFGKKHDRSSILYKDKDRLREICIADSETHKAGDVIRVIGIDPGKPLDAPTVSEIFVGRKLRKDSFELRERQLLNTWHGFEELKLQIQ